jgi:hypothetical protein
MLAITHLIDFFAVHACVEEAVGIPVATVPVAGSPVLLAIA